MFKSVRDCRSIIVALILGLPVSQPASLASGTENPHSHPAIPKSIVLEQRITPSSVRPERLRETLVSSLVLPYLVRVIERVIPAKRGFPEQVLHREQTVADEVLVKLQPNTEISALEALLAQLDATATAHPTRPHWYVVHLSETHLDRVPQALEILQQQPNTIAYAESNGLVQVTAVPNDPRYADGSLWGLHNTGQFNGIADTDIDAPKAWDFARDASDIVVAVIDTGLRTTHEDLADNLWHNPGEIPDDGLDNDGNGFVDDVHGIDPTTLNGDVSDTTGHGTHVSGTIGARGNNGLGVVGVAWRVQLMALKGLRLGNGKSSDLATCIDYARENGADMINNSWGSTRRKQLIAEAVAATHEAGILFIVAAGNKRLDNDIVPNYPSNYPFDNIVTVASHAPDGQLSDFSNFGEHSVHLAAPGFDIISTWGDSDNSYHPQLGTSMAAPHVSGILALLKSRYPEDDYRATIRRLLSSVDRVGKPHDTTGLAGRTITGGRANAANALQDSAAGGFPIIESRLFNTTVVAGQRTLFSVSVSGEAPLRYSWSKDGVILPGADGFSLVIEDTNVTAAGIYRVAVENHLGVRTSTATLSVSVPRADLAAAVDQEESVWLSSGDGQWQVDTNRSRDGVDAVASPLIKGAQKSQIQTSVIGPGKISFFWAVSSEEEFDFLQFLIDNEPIAAISGDQDWIHAEFEIPPGPHSLAWVYFKDTGLSAGEDRGWLDQVVFEPNGGIPPVIVRQPKGVSSLVGVDYELSVEAIGRAPLSYQWRHNGNILTAAEGPTLRFESLTANHPGQYTVDVSNEFGRTASTPVTIAIVSEPLAPRIVRQPNDISVSTGEGAGFSVSIEGTHPFSYHWFQNGESIQGDSQDTLLFEEVTNETAGQYWVEVSNTAGVVTSRIAILKVVDSSLAPTIEKSPQSTTIGVGDSAVLRVQATGFPPLTYLWRRDGKPIEGATDPLLIVAAADRQVAGDYDAIVSNLFGETISEPARVDVFLIAPSIGVAVEAENLDWQLTGNADWFVQTDSTHDGIDAIQSGKITKNQHSSLEVEISGPVSVDFAWRVSSEVFDVLSVFVDNEEHHRIAGERDWQRQSLLVGEGSHRVRWTYRKDDRGTNGSDAGWLDDIRVSPLDAKEPVVIRHPERVGVAEGRPIVLGGQATGSFPLQFQWQKEGSPLPNATSSQLLIEESSSADAGRYTFTVTNEFGSTESRPGIVTVFRRQDPIGQVVNQSGLDWQESENGWRPAVDDSFDEDGAMRSGRVGDGQTSELALAITGPKTVSFQWRVSSEWRRDYLVIYVDDVYRAAMSGIQSWQPYVLELGPGEHVIRWAYEKDASGSLGADGAWIDHVSIEDQTQLYGNQLDNSDLFWTSSGVFLWGSEDNPMSVGGTHVHSPVIDTNQHASIGTTVFAPTPQVVSFRWQISASPGDFLHFFLDGTTANLLSGKADWQTSHALVPPGRHQLRWDFFRATGEPVNENTGRLDSVQLTPYTDVGEALNQAVDTQHWPLFSFGAGGGWQLQTDTTLDGQDALVSGVTGNSDETVLQALVQGPCILNYHWKLSAERFFDLLAVAVDGRVQGIISGEVPWSPVALPIPNGQHVIHWVYRRDIAGGGGSNQAWLDQFECVPVNDVYNQATEGNFEWEIKGQAPWFIQTEDSVVGGDALRSPQFVGTLFESPILAGRFDIAEIGFTEEGPGTLRFNWKQGPRNRGDQLRFIVDGVEQERLIGEQNWSEFEVSVGPGTHYFGWQTLTRYGFSIEADGGYLDNVKFDTLSDPFVAWQRRNFSEEEFGNDAISGPAADPDDDGMSNLAEFAFGTSPHGADTSGLPIAQLTTDGLASFIRLVYRRNEADPRLNYQIEESLDLQTWVPYTEGITREAEDLIGTGLVEVQVRLDRPISSETARFYRIAIQREPVVFRK